MSLIIVHNRRHRPLFMVFDRPGFDNTLMSYTPEAVFCSSPTFQITSKNVRVVSQSVTYPRVRDRCLRHTVSTLVARLPSAVSQFQRLTYNYEFRDYVSIFTSKCRLSWAFQLLSNFGPLIKLYTSAENFSYRQVINWIKSKLIKASYVKRRRTAVRSSIVQILQNRLTDYFFHSSSWSSVKTHQLHTNHIYMYYMESMRKGTSYIK
jgi:hypothetical protein